MSNEHQSQTSIQLANDEPRLINLRFALRNLLARTALADIYWANDLHRATLDSPEKNVLVVLVTPTLVAQQGFAQAWQQILKRPAPPSAAYPDVISYGENDGEYWLVLTNIDGELLSEHIKTLGENGLPLDSALDTLEKINHVLSGIQAGPFGYLEPGAIQKTSNGYIILNAPLVKVQQQLNASSRTTNNKFALHSGYISPSVAVGDAPVTEDDTFSSAALLYALSTGEAPYGERSTLSAVAKESTPVQPGKLSKKSWEVLSSSLAFRRKPREENPDKLLTALRKTNKRKVAFPIAIAASLGLLTFAIYHLTSKVGEFINVPETAQQQAEAIAPEPQVIQTIEPAPVTQPVAKIEPVETIAAEPEVKMQEVAQTEADIQPEKEITPEKTTVASVETEKSDAAAIAKIELVDEPALVEPEKSAPEKVETTTTATNTTEATDNPAEIKAEQVSSLLKQAETAISNNQIKDANNAPGALSLLRQAKELDADNPQTKALISQVLDTTFSNAEQQISSKSFGKAQTNLNEGDKIIREFMVTEQLQRLVRLESKLAVIQQEDDQVKELLIQAKEAISAGNLSKDDSESDYALLHLNDLMLKQPKNPDGLDLLKKVTQLRQQTARDAIQRGELEQAGTYLGESERLIRKYRLSDLQSSQEALNATYANASAQPEPVQEAQRSPEVEIIELQPAQTAPQRSRQNSRATATVNNQRQQPTAAVEQFTEQDNQLPVEKLPVNPISVQNVETVIIEEIAPVEGVLTNDSIPELNATTEASPIWETGVLDSNQNSQQAQQQRARQQQAQQQRARQQQAQQQQAQQQAQQQQARQQQARQQQAQQQARQQQAQPQPIIRYEPQQIPQNTQPIVDNNNGQEIYTYQPTDQQLEPVAQPVFNDFNTPANTIEQPAPAPVIAQQQPQYQPVQQQHIQPQPVQQTQYQPQQQPAQIPQMEPLDMIPELEEIPLSDIEGILSTN